MGILDTNLYAQNVALKNQIGGFTNPFANMQMPNLQLPPMSPAMTNQITIPNPQNTTVANNAGQMTYGNTITEQDLIRQQNPDDALKKEKIKEFLAGLPEHQQVLAVLDPKGFVQTTLKNMETTTAQKNFMMSKDNPEFEKFFYETKNLSPELQYKISQAKLSGEQGMPLGYTKTKAQEEEDNLFVKEFSKFMGDNKLQKELANLDSYNFVINNLENAIKGGTDMTGTAIGLVGDTVRGISFPEAQNNFDTLRGVVMQSLKETLGGQFSEREGQKLIEAAYNPLLSEEINLKRVKRLRDATVGRVVNRMKKKEYFDSVIGKLGDDNFKPAGTLKGYDYNQDLQAMDYNVSDLEDAEGNLLVSESDLTKISDAMVSDIFDVSDYETMTDKELIEYIPNASESEQKFIQQNQEQIKKILKKGDN